jgi:hypothetical protein
MEKHKKSASQAKGNAFQIEPSFLLLSNLGSSAVSGNAVGTQCPPTIHPVRQADLGKIAPENSGIILT